MNKVSIIGLGLMGGSIAKAIRHHQLATSICGFDSQTASLNYAKQHQLIDEACATIQQAVINADLIILATPARHFPNLFQTIAPILTTSQVITDIASTKQNVVDYMQNLNKTNTQFVPGHPIAGSEKSTIEHALDHLFHGANVILTPISTTNNHALSLVKQFWQTLGAKVLTMSAKEHDDIMALISHLPHLTASAYMQLIIEPQLMTIAGGGFRDFTRIAAANPSLWTNICLDNQAAMLEQLDKFIQQLQYARKTIANNDQQALLELFTSAQNKKNYNSL